MLFGAFALVDGAFAVVAAALRMGKEKHWWALLLEGIAGNAAGVITLQPAPRGWRCARYGAEPLIRAGSFD